MNLQNHDGGMAQPVRGVNKNTANEATRVWFFSPGFLNFEKLFKQKILGTIANLEILTENVSKNE